MPKNHPIITPEKTKWNTESYKGSSQTDFHTTDRINLDIGTKDFTVEAWVYAIQINANCGIIQLSNSPGGYTTNCSGNNSLVLNMNGVWHGSWYTDISSQNINNWQHRAMVRHNGATKIYFDGKLVQQVENNGNLDLSYAVIGNYYNGNYPMVGYIDSIRIANHAIYKEEFTPKEFIMAKRVFVGTDRKVYANRW